MRKILVLTVVTALILPAAPALADLFAFELDAQVGYTRIDNIERPLSSEETSLAGGSFGVRGKLEILFISVVADYQHFFNNADFLHAGLGADFKLPLGFVEPYIRGSLGLMMLAAKKGAFDPDAEGDFDPAAGFQVRVGVGMDIPLGEWFAFGVAVDAGYHYITAKHGWDLSAMGYFGLRI
jgi:hypothetical protein